MFVVRGLTYDEMTAEIEEFEKLFRSAVVDVMRAVSQQLGTVLLSAGEPGESDVSIDTIHIISSLWAAEISGTENKPSSLLRYLRGVFYRSVQRIKESFRRVLGQRGADPEEIEDRLYLPDDVASDYLSLAENRMVRFADELWQLAREQLLEGFAEGESIEELRDRLMVVVGLSEGRATVVARTEVHQAAEAGSLAMVQYSEFTGTKTWLATEDARTRPTHVEADGQTVDLEAYFEVGGFPLLFPGDPEGPPQETIQCRCTQTYTLDDEPLVASTTTEEPDNMNDLAAEETLVSADYIPMESETSNPTRWEAVLVVEDTPTGDGRMFSADALTWGEFPMSLLWQKVTDDGHKGSVVVGNIESIDREGNQLIGRGTLDIQGEDGAEAFRMIRDKFLRGVSVDVDSISQSQMEYVYPTEIPEDAEWVVPELVIFHAGRLRGATLCAIPAFVEANIRLVEPEEEEPEMEEVEESILATGGVVDPVLSVEDQSPGEKGSEILLPLPAVDSPVDRTHPLTAAAYVLTIPDVPPAYWFDEPTDVDMHGALTVTDEGRVYGWVAPAKVAHRSFERRVEVPMGNVDYSRFMGRETLVEGGRVVAGALTMDCGHASVHNTSGDVALDHYDNACSVVATVRIGERAGKGVWVAGAVVPGVTANQISRMMACQLSGDWRPHKEKNGWREFAGALLVPVPGFAMARSQASVRMDEGQLVASAVPVEFVETSASCGCREVSPEEEVPVQENFSGVAEFIARTIGRDSRTRAIELRTLVHGSEV